MPGGVRCLLAHGAGHPLAQGAGHPPAYGTGHPLAYLRVSYLLARPPTCDVSYLSIYGVGYLSANRLRARIFLQNLLDLLAATRHYADGGDSAGSRNLARRRLADGERDGGLQPWSGACMHRRVRLPTGPTADGSPPARTRASRPHPHPPSPTRRTCPRTVARPARLRPHRVRDPCRSRRCSGRFHPRFAHIFRLPQARVSDSLPTSSHFVPTYIWYPGATAMLHVAWLLHPRCRRRCKAMCLGGLIREIFPYFVAKWGEVG